MFPQFIPVHGMVKIGIIFETLATKNDRIPKGTAHRKRVTNYTPLQNQRKNCFGSLTIFYSRKKKNSLTLTEKKTWPMIALLKINDDWFPMNYRKTLAVIPPPNTPPPALPRCWPLTCGSPQMAIILPRSWIRPTRCIQSLSGWHSRIRSAVWNAWTMLGTSVWSENIQIYPRVFIPILG